MNVAMSLAISLMLNLLIATVSGSISLAGQEHKSQYSGGRSKQMSNRVSDNSNARWLADPKRGWVRGDERREIVDEKTASNSSKRTRGQAKAGAKTKKPF